MSAIRLSRRVLPASLLSAGAVVCSAYLLAIASAELLLLTAGLLAGAIAHAILIGVLLSHAIAAPRAPYRNLLIALMLPSLIRLMGITIPVAVTPVAIWYFTAGTPAILAAIFAARVVGIPRGLLAWPDSLRLQAVIAVSGITNGMLAYLVLRPAPIPGGAVAIASTALAVVVFVACVEELVFRGILQSVAAQVFRSPGAGLAVGTTASTLMYVGSLSLAFVVVMFAMNLFLAWAVQETGSLWGALGAHAAMAVGLVVVWPLLLP
jgi:membrane protease YdiL (CAAX protease family)